MLSSQLKAKNGIYAVVDSSWFDQYTETISEPDDNGAIYDFMLEQSKGSDIEDEYNEWLKEHFNDYYFEVAKDKDDNHYAVASCRDGIASYAIAIEDINDITL